MRRVLTLNQLVCPFHTLCDSPYTVDIYSLSIDADGDLRSFPLLRVGQAVDGRGENSAILLVDRAGNTGYRIDSVYRSSVRHLVVKNRPAVQV